MLGSAGAFYKKLFTDKLLTALYTRIAKENAAHQALFVQQPGMGMIDNKGKQVMIPMEISEKE